ncbi:MAG: leucine-rich repeat protein [Paludibacteraceae bacterium]|nr:leucine-rich repeat protein [Paludibacteraceae bacterium]
MKKLFLFSVLLLSTTAIWASEQIGGINYVLNDNEMTAKIVTSKPTGDVIIPDSVKSAEKTYVVTEIGSEAFSNCNELTSVVLPNSLKKIGNCAFYECTELTSINLPDSVEEVGVNAFYSCGLTQPVYNKHIFASMPKAYEGAYTVPDGIETIAGGAFGFCTDLTTVSLPSTLKTIMMYAFEASGLREVVIPEGVELIGDQAFNGCDSLHKVSLPSTLQTLGESEFAYCEALDTIITYMTTPTEINNDMFFNVNFAACKLFVPKASLALYKEAQRWNYFDNILPLDALNPIEVDGLYFALDDDNKTATLVAGEFQYRGDIVIPDSIQSNGETYVVTEIYDNAFYRCLGLKSVSLPNGLKRIGDEAFLYCTGLHSVVLPESLESIGKEAFYICSSITSINLPDNVKEIGAEAFSGCQITEPFYNKHCFALMPRTYKGAYTVQDGIETIVGGAFLDCSYLTAITFPTSLKKIGHSAFWYAGLTEVVIPEGVERIEWSAFGNCTELHKAILPSTLKELQFEAFYCEKLDTVVANMETPLEIRSDVFAYVDLAGCTLFVPEGSIDAYRAAEVWKEFGTILPIPQTPTGIENVQGEVQRTKALRDGQLLIIRDGAVYNVCGQRVSGLH